MKVTILSALFSSYTAFYGVNGYQDVRNNLQGHRILEIHSDHLNAEVHELLHRLQADHVGRSNEKMAIKVAPESLNALNAAGVPHLDATDDWIAHFQSNFDNPNLFCTESPEECASRTLQDFYSDYQNLAALTERVQSAVDGSDLAEIKQIGTSHEGRPINVVEIGDPTKPLAYFMCNVHAREWLPAMYCPFMIESLLADGGHRLLDSFSFAIIPTGNPDGYVFSVEENNLWRKNRKENPGSNCIGTDLNRNYDNNFGGQGTSTNVCSDVFRGTTPFDTLETAAINAYGLTRSDTLITWIDFHSFGSFWLSPLGFAVGLPPAEDFDRMSECMDDTKAAIEAVGGPSYEVGGAANLLGAAAGASDDFFYFEFDVVYSFTAEMKGDSFQPDPSFIASNNVEIFAGMVAQMDCINRIEFGVIDTGSASTTLFSSTMALVFVIGMLF